MRFGPGTRAILAILLVLALGLFFAGLGYLVILVGAFLALIFIVKINRSDKSWASRRKEARRKEMPCGKSRYERNARNSETLPRQRQNRPELCLDSQGAVPICIHSRDLSSRKSLDVVRRIFSLTSSKMRAKQLITKREGGILAL